MAAGGRINGIHLVQAQEAALAKGEGSRVGGEWEGDADEEDDPERGGGAQDSQQGRGEDVDVGMCKIVASFELNCVQFVVF